jgi:inner membrane protein
MGAKSIGKRALIIGGSAQLIPDVDVLFSLTLDPATNALAHRGFTHSFLFVLVITPLLAWSFVRWWRGAALPFNFWIKFLGLQILLHVLLDACNAYGTGWFEPFHHFRVSLHALFVADPFFSIPVGVACCYLLIARASYKGRIKVAIAAIVLSSAYLGYSVANKIIVTNDVERALADQSIPYDKFLTTPTPFNSWLWFIATTGKGGSYVGYRSVFDASSDIDFEFFPRNDSLKALASNSDEIAQLVRFSQGYYTLSWKADTLVFNDLRFGQMLGWQNPRAEFSFHYYLSPALDNKLVLQRGRFAKWDRSGVKAFISRIKGVGERQH